MSTYTQILFHVVFGTKNRQGTLDLDRHEELRKYITGVLKNNNCITHQVGGYFDHVHLLFRIHPSVALASLVKDIKLSTSDWIRKNNIFPRFEGWQQGYSAFSCSWSVKDDVARYIANQVEHHQKKSFTEEWKTMLERAGIEFDERFP